MSVTTETSRVILGAGDWYIADYTTGAIDLATVAVAANLIGNTQGGATIEYAPETYTIEDDMGRVRRSFQTKANATMKTGILTYYLPNLANLWSVGTLTTTAATSSVGEKNKLELPAGRCKLKQKIVVFKYTDDDGAVILIGMVATNSGTLSLAFAKDKETVPEITFTAECNDTNDGVLVIIEETKALST